MQGAFGRDGIGQQRLRHAARPNEHIDRRHLLRASAHGDGTFQPGADQRQIGARLEHDRVGVARGRRRRHLRTARHQRRQSALQHRRKRQRHAGRDGARRGHAKVIEEGKLVQFRHPVQALGQQLGILRKHLHETVAERIGSPGVRPQAAHDVGGDLVRQAVVLTYQRWRQVSHASGRSR